MVKKCLTIGCCAVSEVKVETLFLLEIQKGSDNSLPLKEQHEELRRD